MSTATNSNSILKVLSDLSAAADQIIEEKDSDIMFPDLLEWMSMIRCKAIKIVESESLTPCKSLDEIPNLMTYLNRANRKCPRISAVLPRVSHLHKKGRNTSTKAKSRNSSLKAQSVRKSSKLKLRKTEKIEHHSTSSNQLEEKTDSNISLEDKTPPVNGKSANTATVKRSSKRKSSTELLEAVKKPKLILKIGGKNAPREEGSTQNMKLEKQLMKAKYSSHLLSNTKSSTSGIAVLKEENNAKRSMIIEAKQQKAVLNRKNILAVRQQKLEENKRAREEKIEKTRQQRMKLEKEKRGKLKDKCGIINQEKSLRKRETTSVKDATPKAKNPSIYNLPSSSAKKPLLNPKKDDKVISLLASKAKATPPPVFKNNPHQREQPVPNKSDTQAVEKEIVLNTTYNAEETGSTSNKEKNASQAYKKGKAVAHAKKADKPLVEAEKHYQTPGKKKVVESYDLTPARTSFVSYDISEIRSDSEDEEQNTNSKPMPSWATGVRLRNALLHQYHHPLDTDDLFGNYFEPPDLGLIMGVRKQHYKARTSSALWNISAFT